MTIIVRDTEAWIGKLGIFWGRITGIELPSGRFIGFTYGFNKKG